MLGHMNLIFPSVLRELTYADSLSAKDRRSVSLSYEEALDLCRSYLRDMYLGVRYDGMIREDWNTSTPNKLVDRNIEAANAIGARYKYQPDDPLVQVPIPALERIPVNADAFETDQFDGIAADILSYLDDFKGVDVSVASKLMHQKRSSYFPIFDMQARRVLGVPWTRGYGSSDYQLLFTWYREAAFQDDNVATITRVADRLNSETDEGRRFCFARVRVLDILAWGISQYRDPFK